MAAIDLWEDLQLEKQLAEFQAQIALEAREQMSGFDINCVEAFKRGDRIGLPFESGSMFEVAGHSETS